MLEESKELETVSQLEVKLSEATLNITQLQEQIEQVTQQKDKLETESKLQLTLNIVINDQFCTLNDKNCLIKTLSGEP